MLIHKDTITTVTFDSGSSTNYAYPETGMYGEDVEVVIQHHHNDDIDNSVTVTIGDKMYTPAQLERILVQVDAYKSAAKAFEHTRKGK